MKTSIYQPGKQPDLSGLLAFECVARHLNFTKAAAEMEVSATAMSKAIRKLESRLSVRLLNRTTRSVGLTTEGAQLLCALSPALEQVKLSIQQIGDSTTSPKGVLRVNTSYVAYVLLVHRHLAEFSRRFPDIKIEISSDNSLTNIVEKGYDVGIRLGHIVERDMIGVPIGPRQRLAVVGTRAYLNANGVPLTPADLVHHNCIRHLVGEPARVFEWKFVREGGIYVASIDGHVVYNDMRCALEASKAGLGLAYVFRQFAEPELHRRELVAVLQEHCAEAGEFYLYYANRNQMSSKMRAFIDFIKQANESPGEVISIGRRNAGYSRVRQN
ncbi:LysR family transcriptional regulator [Burkholderia metallica]|uniref:LysR family transcriptional regulator n=1 Tax=Burkholderia metallica TaxID=488729 RepID=UPI001CF28DC0|nr:LysR family transcriptional regulator [Burkholderia metallica]MCA8002739.1 LysR family transcriptional regulator [Burkholderia metallica]